MLATEPRVLITRECDTGQSCSVPVDVILEVCLMAANVTYPSGFVKHPLSTKHNNLLL